MACLHLQKSTFLNNMILVENLKYFFSFFHDTKACISVIPLLHTFHDPTTKQSFLNTKNSCVHNALIIDLVLLFWYNRYCYLCIIAIDLVVNKTRVKPNISMFIFAHIY